MKKNQKNTVVKKILENILIYFCISQSIYYYKNDQITIFVRRMRAYNLLFNKIFINQKNFTIRY